MRRKNPFTLNTQLSLKKRPTLHDFDTFSYDKKQNPSQSISIPVDKKRFIIGSLVCLFVLMIFFIRVLSLQNNAEAFLTQADNNRTRVISEIAPRGIIFDRNQVALTTNSPDVGLFITLESFPDDEQGQQDIFVLIAEYTNKSLDEVMQAFSTLQKSSSIEPLPLIEHLSHEEAIKLSVHQDELPGIQIRPQILREYPYPESLAHVVGYIGKISETEWAALEDDSSYTLADPIGKSGIEKSYESAIKGKNGKLQVEVDAFGHVTSVLATEPPVSGQNLTLTLDAEFQTYLYDELAKATEKANGTGAAAVAINPQNGEVLALVSWPSFNANDFNAGLQQSVYTDLLNDPRKPLFNRAISGEYPSGSTIKPLIASAALQEGVITPQTTVMSTGGIQVGVWSFPDWKAGGHGVTNVRKAIAESVNTFFYAIGGGWQNIEGLGVDRIVSYAQLFGLNQKLKIDIDGEATGFLPSKEWKEQTKGESWYIGDTYHLAIGQGDLSATPLQVSSYVSVISNGGTLFKPRLVKAIGQENTQPEIIHEKFISTNNLNTVRQGMRDTVLSGSARSLQSVPMTVGAKTGTAQFGTGDQYHAWLTAFAPFENPEIVLTVLIEGGGEGSITAAPVVRNALTWWANHR